MSTLSILRPMDKRSKFVGAHIDRKRPFIGQRGIPRVNHWHTQQDRLEHTNIMLCFAAQSSSFAARALRRSLHRTNVCRQHTRRRLVPARRLQTSAVGTNMILDRKSAAAVVIGDEILTGKTQDANTQTLAKFLVEHGVVLTKTETILDDIDTISATVRRLSKEHDLVFTSGGIGPTLDDLTYAGVAKAFGLPLEEHKETLRMMREIQPHMEINAARLRMAILPAPCETFWTGELWVPLACVNRNVYVLPGIPSLFSKMLRSVPKERLGEVRARARAVVLCELSEGDLAATLDEAHGRNADLAFGSYPATTEDARKLYRTMITVEGDDDEEVAMAAQEVCVAVQGKLWEDQ